jgi:hypothetical protein
MRLILLNPPWIPACAGMTTTGFWQLNGCLCRGLECGWVENMRIARV